MCSNKLILLQASSTGICTNPNSTKTLKEKKAFWLPTCMWLDPPLSLLNFFSQCCFWLHQICIGQNHKNQISPSIIVIILEYSTQILTKEQKHRPKHRKVFSRTSEEGIFQNQEICFSFDYWLLFETFNFQTYLYASLIPVNS